MAIFSRDFVSFQGFSREGKKKKKEKKTKTLLDSLHIKKKFDRFLNLRSSPVLIFSVRAPHYYKTKKA